MSNDNLFGKYMKEYRDSKGLSISDLHKITGVSQPYLSQLEKGTKKPSRKIISKIAARLTDNIEDITNYNDLYKILLNKAGYNTDWKYLDEMEDLKELKKGPELIEQAISNYKQGLSTPVYLNKENEGNFYFFTDQGTIDEKLQEKLNTIIKIILD
ncbi:helix-turn-helix domain-containing protein [Sediminibacillus terrae]|uniref:helix-turn-helix domain-containing protein n=1 Tax=Sediminibacillus terrae TaxID=1562106 RepID=UPI001297AC50|nr:helix-turn-helix transcriptional regulator [Sediminibacillus terrae]